MCQEKLETRPRNGNGKGPEERSDPDRGLPKWCAYKDAPEECGAIECDSSHSTALKNKKQSLEETTSRTRRDIEKLKLSIVFFFSFSTYFDLNVLVSRKNIE